MRRIDFLTKKIFLARSNRSNTNFPRAFFMKLIRLVSENFYEWVGKPMVSHPLVKILCGQSNEFHEKSSWENDLWTIWSSQKNFFIQTMHLADFKQLLIFDFQDFHLIFTLPKLRWQSLRKKKFQKKNFKNKYTKSRKNRVSWWDM